MAQSQGKGAVGRILEVVGGSVVVLLLAWIASSVSGLKESAAVFVEWKAAKDKQDDKQDDRLDRIEGRK